jgi:HEAT repeat protein
MARMHRTWIAVLLFASPSLAQDSPDPLKLLKAKEPEVRLAAVGALSRGEPDPKVEKALLGLLDDEDWEVVIAATRALGVVGGEKSIAELVKLSVEGPVRAVRASAATSAAALDAERTLTALGKLAGGKRGVAACEAIATIAPLTESSAATKGIEKALKAKDDELRRAGARAFLGLEPDEWEASLQKLLAADDATLNCAALDAVAAEPSAAHLPLLIDQLGRRGLSDVVERRSIRAMASVVREGLAGSDKRRADEVLSALGASGEVTVQSRRMRLLAELGRFKGGGSALAELVNADLARGLEHADESVRAAALHAGAGLASRPILERAAELVFSDPSARVRRTALASLLAGHRKGKEERDSVVASAPPGLAEVLALATDVLADDAASEVRELAAVALGLEPVDGSVAVLTAALDDEDWRVSACAAVSLGKIGDVDVIPALVGLFAHDDWRRRGAGVVGLTKMNRAEVVPPLFATLDDPEPAVRRSAWGFLRSIARTDLPVERGPWEKWWESSSMNARFVDEDALQARREKYGYAKKSNEELFLTVFQELDVVVLDSRGDHIQKLLERLEIEHRMTAAARHTEDALHPAAVYVSNCTGEVEGSDIERLQWFVTTGGYLFGSCWALSQTIEEVAPGVVAKFETSGEVLDTVEAEPVVPDSRWLEGVFDDGVRPLYELQGAHLIEVLDPERAEVLIDSPECAAAWGEGNLAVWFRAGHGLILDSVNHFDLQGLESAVGLKKPEERQAHAVDRLGLSFEELRKVRDESWWGSNTKAARQVADLSAFRFLTNFVRHKRLHEE